MKYFLHKKFDIVQVVFQWTLTTLKLLTIWPDMTPVEGEDCQSLMTYKQFCGQTIY